MVQRGVKYIYLLLGLGCALAQDITVSDTETENINNETVPCDQYVIKRLGSCCSLPNLILREVMETCFVSECTRFGSGMFSSGMPFHFMGWRSLFSGPGLLFPSFPGPDIVTPPRGERPRNPDSGMNPGVDESPQNPEVPDAGALGIRTGFPVRRGRFPVPEGDKDAEWVGTKAQRGRKNKKGYLKNEEETTNSRSKRHVGFGRSGRGGRGRYMCSMECAFRNQSWLTTEGGVDVTALKNSLSNINNDTWQPVLNEALNECSDQLPKANLTAVPGSENCNPGPGLFAACLRRYMALKCPETLTKDNELCTSHMTSLKSCNPFAAAMCNRGRSRGGWGGRRRGEEESGKPDKFRSKNRG